MDDEQRLDIVALGHAFVQLIDQSVAFFFDYVSPGFASLYSGYGL